MVLEGRLYSIDVIAGSDTVHIRHVIKDSDIDHI